MWKAKGVIYDSMHCQLPTVKYIGMGMIRLYFSTKIDGKSYIYFVDLDEETLQVVEEAKEALSPGERGSFDHAGVMPSCIIDEELRTLMYYTGWSLKKDVPYSHAIGVAILEKDGTLRRGSGGPVLSLNNFDPYLVNSPYVEIERRDNREKWKMLYCSGTGWIEDYPTYHISSATGDTGFSWHATGNRVITHNKKDEAISRVSKNWSDHSLYYSWRTKNEPYRLGRMSHSGEKSDVDIERGEWDSEMQCYPFIYTRDSCQYMFYNGNGYGATGIGVAKWTKDTA